jgi:hypothetical protein
MLAVIVALAPYALQLLEMVPGFIATAKQLRTDLAAHPDISAADKAKILGTAKSDVDAADDKLQAEAAADIPPPAPTAR